MYHDDETGIPRHGGRRRSRVVARGSGTCAGRRVPRDESDARDVRGRFGGGRFLYAGVGRAGSGLCGGVASGAGVQPARRRHAGERAEPCGPSAGRARRIGTGGEPVAVLRRTDGRKFRCDGAAGDRSLPGTPQSLRRADAGRFGASGGPRAGGPPGTSGFRSGSVLCSFGYGHHAGRHRQGVHCGPGFRRADVRRGEEPSRECGRGHHGLGA